MTNLNETNPPFWGDLHEKLMDRINAIQKDAIGTIRRAERLLRVAQEAAQALDKGLETYAFSDLAEEIYFFKEIKPAFRSMLIFYSRMYQIELGLPLSPKAEQELYLKRELTKIHEFYQDNRILFGYLRAGETYLDDRFFCNPATHSATKSLPFIGREEPVSPVGMDYVVARIKASELLYDYLNRALTDLHRIEATATVDQPSLVWTESKAGLIELAYALQSCGAFNNGKAELREIIDGLQRAFNVNLGNYSRTFQEILSRKNGYTTFLDRLSQKLLLRIQVIEEKHIK